MKYICFTALVFLWNHSAAHADADIQSSTFNHPTLPVKLTVSTQGTPEACKYSVLVISTKTNEVIYRDSGIMAPLFEKSLHKLGVKNFRHDLNFDGHKEFFLEDNNPLHNSDFKVYIFNQDKVKKLRLQFSEITFDAQKKRFICNLSNGFNAPPSKITYEFKNGNLQRILE